jgi:hypothetical protein
MEHKCILSKLDLLCNTNKTRAEFSKNDSLKALMERFPLEHNVVWANYTPILVEGRTKTHKWFLVTV